MNNNILENYIRESILQINESSLKSKIKGLNKESTYGELKTLLNAFVVSNNAKKGIEVAKASLGFTAVGGFIDIVHVLKSLSNIKDKDRPDNFLSGFDLDDEVSEIVDNDLENDFIKELSKKINSFPDTKKVGDFNMTNHLRGFLAKKFNNRTITGFPKN